MQIVLGVALGAGVGAALSAALGIGSAWLAIGIAVGVAIGATMSRKSSSTARANDQRLSTNDLTQRSPIMALLERVSTLVRANLNDLIDKAEHPEKMIKQVILDMQNQLLQVKTQVAIAIADEHLLEKKQKEYEEKVAEWMRKAELAVDKKEDDLARAALQRAESYRELTAGFAQQVIDQKAQVENLKTALRQLEQKLAEAQAKADLLIAQHRRARAVGKASDAEGGGQWLQRQCLRPHETESSKRTALSQAKSELAADDSKGGSPPWRKRIASSNCLPI